MLMVETHMLQMMIAISYLTLGVLAPGEARKWWWIYAIITLFVSVVNLFLEWKADRNDKR